MSAYTYSPPGILREWDIAKQIAPTLGLPIIKAKALVHLIIQTIVKGIQRDSFLKVQNFGRIKLKYYKEVRNTYNYVYHDYFTRPARWKLVFEPSADICHQLNVASRQTPPELIEPIARVAALPKITINMPHLTPL